MHTRGSNLTRGPMLDGFACTHASVRRSACVRMCAVQLICKTNFPGLRSFFAVVFPTTNTMHCGCILRGAKPIKH